MPEFNVDFTVVSEEFGRATYKGEDMTEQEARDLTEELIESKYPSHTEFTIDRVVSQ